jgi:hypothetical protein
VVAERGKRSDNDVAGPGAGRLLAKAGAAGVASASESSSEPELEGLRSWPAFFSSGLAGAVVFDMPLARIGCVIRCSEVRCNVDCTCLSRPVRWFSKVQIDKNSGADTGTNTYAGEHHTAFCVTYTYIQLRTDTQTHKPTITTTLPDLIKHATHHKFYPASHDMNRFLYLW